MRAAIANVVMTIVIAGVADAADVARAKADEAMAICRSVDRMGGDARDRADRLETGLQLAEDAVAADANELSAHMAVVCNLGKRLESTGIGLRTLGRVHRMKEAIDRATAIAPDAAEVLIAKGEFLSRLPAFLGGDHELGRALLQRAVELHPDDVRARLYLARALAADGSPEARARLNDALAAARRCGAPAEQSEAQALLASLPD
jgi:tetratricopeptide (TPR) repeat protein